VRRTTLATAALAATLALLGAGCGGTLEGKYRRGELTTSTTTPRAPATTPSTSPTTSSAPGGPAPSTSTTTPVSSGNAVRTGRSG
jgi:hypothetical protein